MSIECERLAPLRSNTRGYTGCGDSDQRGNFVYIKENVQEMIDRTKLMIATNFEGMDAFTLTHFVRGELFVFIDSLLATHFYSKAWERAESSKEEVDMILNACEVYCLLYCTWLEMFPRLYPSVLFERP